MLLMLVSTCWSFLLLRLNNKHGWLKNDKSTVPRERAFHSAVVMGNYMVVYGGNTHEHDALEVCYSRQIYFYHLSCHKWLNDTYFTSQLLFMCYGCAC